MTQIAMAIQFNDLLRGAGISPADVRLLRHHTKPGLKGMSLFDLWTNDRNGFERYQSTQSAGATKFRTASYFASFVCPDPSRTLFVGLYETQYDGTRRVPWLCPYRGDKPGGGEPVDVFRTALRPELSGHIGKLEIEWDSRNVRTWARYAEGAPFEIVGTLPLPAIESPLRGQALVDALLLHGFRRHHATKKVEQLRRGNIVIYLKREIRRFPLLVHPRYLDLASDIMTLRGIDFEQPARSSINSNLTEFPVYEADHRETSSRHGFALGVTAGGLVSLIDFLDGGSVVETPDGVTRVFGTSDDPLTERERLAAARVGQGEFRNALISRWRGTCPIVGVDHLGLLRASHIKPWRASNNRERLDPFNGILLCSHIDVLFDRGLISFEDDGTLLVSRLLSDANLGRLGLQADAVLIGFEDRHRPYLAYHRGHVFCP